MEEHGAIREPPASAAGTAGGWPMCLRASRRGRGGLNGGPTMALRQLSEIENKTPARHDLDRA